MIVSTPREVLWSWMHQRLGLPWSDEFRAIAVIKNDCIAAAIGYNGFTGRACFMHSAIDDPSVINRTFVRAMFEYPFNQCGCTHVIVVVHGNNQHALDIDLRVGFKEVHRLVGGGLEGDDLIFLQMSREECRWIRGESDGKISATGT